MKRLWILVVVLLICISPVIGEIIPNEVYFDNEAVNPVVELINNAEESIIIQMYGFTNYEPVISALKESAEKGVEVRILLDNQGANNPENINDDGDVIGCPEEMLEKAGAVIRWDKRTYLLHRKVMVIDSNAVFLGSTNWTNNGFENNREIDICIHDPEVAKKITDKFNEDWDWGVHRFTDELKEPEPKLLPPTNLEVAISYDTVLVVWEEPEDTTIVEGYNVYRRKSGEEYEKKPINDEIIIGRMFYDKTAKDDETYCYKMTSVDYDGNESDFSEEVEFHNPIVLRAVTNLKAEKIGSTVKITWSSDQNVTFKVTRIAKSMKDLGETKNKYFIDENPPKEKIIYKVSAARDGKYSLPASVTIDLTEEKKSIQYVGAKTTKKFHKLTCGYADKIKSSNKVYFYTREEALSQGYTPCGTCKP